MKRPWQMGAVWTDDELRVLRQHYYEGGADLCMRHSGALRSRGWASVKSKAYRLGLTKKRVRRTLPHNYEVTEKLAMEACLATAKLLAGWKAI